jgi:hypothetical protein
MQYTTLGGSGLRISRLCLGAMTFGAGSGIWGEIAGLDRAQATRLVSLAVERGINLIDTADAYSQGHSETVVGEALAGLGLDESRRARSAGRDASCARRSRDAGEGAAHRRLQLQRGRSRACTGNHHPHAPGPHR